jgi:hypothetical protein
MPSIQNTVVDVRAQPWKVIFEAQQESEAVMEVESAEDIEGGGFLG